MAQFVNMFDVDLEKRSYPVILKQTVTEGNVSANRIGAYVYKDGAEYNLGGSCTGMVLRADGTTVPLTGVIDGNAAYVVLDQPSCAIAGPIQVAVNWVSGSRVTTLLVAYGTCIRANTRSYIQPGTPIPDINELLAAIDEMRQATEDAEAAATQLAPKVISLFSTDATAIPANSNLDDYTTPGNYLIANASIASTVTNYPFTVGGRVIVGQTTTANSLVQIVIPNNNAGIVVRTRGVGTWSEWSTPMKGTLSETASLDDFRAISIYAYTPSVIESLTSFPGRIPTSAGGLIVTINSADILNGRVQYVIPWTTEPMMAKRYYQTNWSAWGYTQGKTTTITVGQGGDYISLVDALDYVTGPDMINTWSEDNNLVIQLGEGTFSMNKVVDLYNSDNTRYKWGLYIPRCCSIKGAGKDRTIITYDYSGDDSWILGHLSPINMPYESSMEDLTIRAKNCRYCVHSDEDEPFSRSWAISNNTITVKNVRMINEGYDEGRESSYNVPSAWGAGIHTNVTRNFINCDFEAYFMPWFCHNKPTQSSESRISFDNCRFINRKTDATFSSTNAYGGPTFISWGSKVMTLVDMKNCYTNRYICIRPNTAYVSDTTCEYFLHDDSGAMVEESKTNNAHLLDAWINRNCMVAVAGRNITGYAPVSVSVDGVAGTYSASGYRHGIALFSVTSGNSLTVQTEGLVDLGLIGVSGFAAGALVGYSGGAWVADSTHPIIRVVTTNIGELV